MKECGQALSTMMQPENTFLMKLLFLKIKAKFSGFSHTIFIGENNRQETGMKLLKIKKKSGKILIEDDGLIYNNYAEPAPKGVKQ